MSWKQAIDRDQDASPEQQKQAAQTVESVQCLIFPERLMQVLQSNVNDDAIWWSPDGTNVWIASKKFAKTVLNQFFQGSKFSSFTRKLHRWGFQRALDGTLPAGAVVYYHDMFQRDKPELIVNMKIVKRKERLRQDEAMWNERLFGNRPALAAAAPEEVGESSSAITGVVRPSEESFKPLDSNRQQSSAAPVAAMASLPRLLQRADEERTRAFLDSKNLSSLVLPNARIQNQQPVPENFLPPSELILASIQQPPVRNEAFVPPPPPPLPAAAAAVQVQPRQQEERNILRALLNLSSSPMLPEPPVIQRDSSSVLLSARRLELEDQKRAILAEASQRLLLLENQQEELALSVSINRQLAALEVQTQVAALTLQLPGRSTRQPFGGPLFDTNNPNNNNNNNGHIS